MNKTMIPIGGRPVLEYVICHLQYYGFTDIVIAVGVHKKQIMNYFRDGTQWDVNITYSVSDEPQGTAGELSVARRFFENEPNFFVYYGDILCNTDLCRFYEHHLKRKSVITLNGITGLPIEFGIIEFDDSNKVTAFKEKPSLPVVTNNPLFFCTQEILESENVEIGKDFSYDVFPEFVCKDKVSVYHSDGYCYDVGNLSRLKAITELFNQGKVGTNDGFPSGGFGNAFR